MSATNRGIATNVARDVDVREGRKEGVKEGIRVSRGNEGIPSRCQETMHCHCYGSLDPLGKLHYDIYGSLDRYNLRLHICCLSSGLPNAMLAVPRY